MLKKLMVMKGKSKWKVSCREERPGLKAFLRLVPLKFTPELRLNVLTSVGVAGTPAVIREQALGGSRVGEQVVYAVFGMNNKGGTAEYKKSVPGGAVLLFFGENRAGEEDYFMQEKLRNIAAQARQVMAEAQDLDSLNELRVRFLGKKGELTQVLRGMGGLSAEERPIIGQLANEVREEIEAELSKRTATLKEELKRARLSREVIDITLPGTVFNRGKLHPLTTVMRQIEDIFLGFGFSIAEGPEVELDYYNFEALNLPKDHPARDMQDSFFITADTLLRTHTSPVQARTYEKNAPHVPIKIIAPGKVYRRDDDATHSPMFHQVEGIVVDRHITFGNLKGILQIFAEQMFGPETRTRFRTSFFPFTEPSAEVDISCVMCGGSGCRVCSHTGWLEILGCGMIHPRVLEFGGYNSEEVTGFAFGMGVERIAMLKYGIDDLRLLFENDLRFLAQF